MIFTKPIPFHEALQSRAVKAILPTNMSAAELEKLDVDIRERSMFSARNMYEEYLQTAGNGIAKIIEGKLDQPSLRLELKQLLKKLNYIPEPGTEGTLLDFSSTARIDLVIETNVQMAAGYGQWRQGQQEFVLKQWPASELYRREDRTKERDWETRWIDAAHMIGDEDALQVFTEGGGRMIARKDSPIWEAISRWSQPYPPFDYNSGMWTRDTDADEAESLGLPIDNVRPQFRGFEMEAAA